MGSSYFGDRGSESGRSGSYRKGKKSSSDKPKQPQRGLGVAQLEKIRLQSQMAAYLPSHHSPFLSNPNREDMRLEMGYSPSPSSSSSTASSSSLFGVHPNTMMGFENTGRTDSIYGPLQSSHAAYHQNIQSTHATRTLSSSSLFLTHHATQSAVTLPLFDETMEDQVQKKRRHDRRHSTGSLSQNSDSSDTQELDLDLKLSL